MARCVCCPEAYAAPKIPIQMNKYRDNSSVYELGELIRYRENICHNTANTIQANKITRNPPNK